MNIFPTLGQMPMAIMIAVAAILIVLLGILVTVLVMRRKGHSSSRQQPLLEGVADGFVVLDKDRRVTAHNSRLQGLLPQQLAGSNTENFQGESARNLYTQLCDDSTQVIQRLDHWLANLHADKTSAIELPDRQNRQLLIRERPIEAGVITATVRDISEQVSVAQQLDYANDYDPLTDLPNRTLFMSQLRDFVRTPGTSFALLICDIRDFRQINDSYGQQFGDQLLVSTGQKLKLAMPADALVARISGDEFAVLVHCEMPQSGLTSDIEEKASRFLQQIGEGVSIGSRSLPVRASMGISYCPQDGCTVGELKSAADSACALAKSEGNNSIAPYNRRWQQAADRDHQLDIGLGKALMKDEFHLQYQPQIDIASGMTAGMEALIRWDSASLGRVSPAEFIPRAERSERIVEIGEWVLHRAISDYKTLAKFGMSPSTLSVNLSRRQFADERMIHNIERIIKDSDIEPALLTLEITETAILSDRDSAVKLLRSLHDLGVNLSIDDFGVGYSSFLELRDFPINEVKIDRTFVSDLDSCQQSRDIIKATVSVAESIGAEVVAEGIETREQFELVKALGCHRAQGYFLCEPLSATTIPDVCLGGSIKTNAPPSSATPKPEGGNSDNNDSALDSTIAL